jgi:uncharacterized protein (TIGR02646 family)
VIRITKRNEAPAKLADGVAVVEDYEGAIRAAPDTAGREKERFIFKKTIYGHSTVKNALMEDQHQKCCYCEGYFAGHSSGDVEHYRPKAFSLQSEKGTKIYPGYYWLAYAWSNLYCSCEICNRVRKRNLFPLKDNSRRARRPSDRLEDEEPLLIDPGGAVDPRAHVKFIDNVPRGATELGRRTVEVLGLDRPALNRARLPFFRRLAHLHRVASLPDSEMTSDALKSIRADARTELHEMIGPESEYSAMVQDYLEAHNH